MDSTRVQSSKMGRASHVMNATNHAPEVGGT